MDEDPLHYNAGLTNLSHDNTFPYLCLGLGTSGGTKPCFSNGCNRKWNIASSSLALGLGSSSTSCITPNVLEATKPEIDLELSLSTCPAESGITFSSGNGSSLHHNASLPLASLSTTQLVDEESASSRWKHGLLFTPLSCSESISVVNQIPTSTHKALALSDISSPVKATENLVAFTSGPVHQEQRRANVRTCCYEGCTRGARGASGLCIAHGGGRRCQKIGCQKGAEGRTVFCKAHGGGRRCQYLGCTKSAEGRTEYCIGHGGGRRCSHEGCNRASRGKSGLCIRHGGGKRCTVENCSKSAEGISGLCISHGGGRRCQYPDCTKGSQGSTMFCKAHGGGRRCTYLGCVKGAEGSTPFCKGHGGGKRCTSEGCTKSVHGGTLFCVSHGGGKRCVSPGCTKSARGRTDFCVRHGGGKRCKSEGCTKSAQGSTDYCKAHGGGKRCSWGQLGYDSGGQDAVLCDKFARGKSGLCASHASQIEKMSNSGSTRGPTLQDVQSSGLNNTKDSYYPNEGESMSVGFMNYGCEVISLHMPSHENLTPACAYLNDYSLPEGRVHGGSLMAMLRGTSSQTGNSGVGGLGKSLSLPHSYV